MAKNKSRKKLTKYNYYDPPEGWRYGFPKPYKPFPGESLAATLRRDGYPEKLIASALKATRFWHDPTV